MRRFIVELVDTGSDDVVWIEVWPDFGKDLGAARHKLFGCLVDVGHDKITVDYHHGAGRVVEARGLAQVFKVDAFLRGDVRGKLYNLEDGAIAIDNRVVDRLDPDFGSVLFEPLEFAFVFLALGQFPPELLVVVGCDIVGIAEDLVMASLDFVQRVAKGIQKVFVCRGDCAIGPELDDSLGPIEAFENAGIHAGIGHVVPFQHVADVIAVFVEDAADIQGEFVIANGNVGFPGQVGGI